eukprot:CAMPEP_0203900506 /NCGR_PEP_ID=MMETSP0359-20131031/42771_1 /ASSEMBLY_ACC=CAM_ASM_000338 /TAXON_ID=268821 /ORGANISM="Scrippsiella Hangoei, Strain SHTV-5" /LENGTH=248 /DNA_ID=CAMNT_0050823985 /DNA_START=24 /DNA_END=766 /DNA_ORIENTATION=+
MASSEGLQLADADQISSLPGAAFVFEDFDGEEDDADDDDASDDEAENGLDVVAGPQPAIQVPPPAYDASIFVLACRPVGKMSKFAERTLLFQPDVRPFCANGLKCRLLGSAEHTARRSIHMERKALLRMAVIDCAAHTTEVVTESGAEVAQETLPYVRLAFDAARGGIPRSPLGAAGSADASRRPIVVYVHGFRERYARHINTLCHLRHVLVAGSVDVAAAPAIVGFLWPCHKKGLAYGRSREKADLA